MFTLRNSLKLPILLSYILLTVVTFSIIAYFIFSTWKTSSERMVVKSQADITNIILSQIESFINTPLNLNRTNHDLLEKKVVDISRKHNREVYFASILQSTGEEVYSFTYGTETGEYYGARRNEKNELELVENDALTNGKSRYYAITPELTAGPLVYETEEFDPRTREWYKAAKEGDKPVFSSIYKHFVMNDLAISAAYPIHDEEGRLIGVLGTHITLTKINDYLKSLVANRFVTAYIVEKNTGYLVANSTGRPNFEPLDNKQIRRISIGELDNGAVVQAFNEYQSNAVPPHLVNVKGDRLFVGVTEYHQEGLDWLIITAVPQGPFIVGITTSIKLSILISIIAIIIAVIIYMKSVEIVLRPVYHLIKTTEKFSAGDFGQRARVFRTDEIGKLSMAFNNMAEHIFELLNTLAEKIKARTQELEETVIQLRNSEEDIRLLLDSTAEAIYGIDTQGNCTFCNASCLKMLRYERAENLIGKNMHRLIYARSEDGKAAAPIDCRMLKALNAGEYVHAEDEIFWRADGTSFPAEYFSYPQYRGGKIIGAVITFFDITERKKSQGEIIYLSYHDQLTGLYNRRFYEEELRRLDTPRSYPLTIVMADMNGLKLINDSLGHTAGDKLLMKTAEVLTKGCRSGDIVARLGGDEFVVLLPNTTSAEAEQLITRIKNAAAKEEVGSINLSISFGYSTKNSLEENTEDIVKAAEDQMYRVKLYESPSMRGRTINTIISTLNEKNKREEQHSQRVSELCELMGNALQLTEADAKELTSAGLLHDIGKIAMDDSILNKPGELTDSEWEEIKRHPEVGYRILSTVNHMSQMAEYVLAHHERWDGGGYPKGLRGTEIPLQARVIQILDAYESMTSDRSYRSTLTEEEAIIELRQNAGTQFDPELVDIFLKDVLGCEK